jgi:pre-rRNA-processing protein IPI1
VFHRFVYPLGSERVFSQLETELQYKGNFKTCWGAEEKIKLEEWIIHLPQILWELGSNNLVTTEV